VNRLVGEMLRRAKALQTSSGEACFRFWFPQVSGPPDIATLMDPQAYGDLMAAMLEVIRTSAEDPVPMPDKSTVEDKLAAVVNGMYEQFGEDTQMIGHTDDPRVDRGKVCTMTIALYERIMAWPPAESAALIRSMTQVP
jgi:hypothetical protein